MLALTPSHYGRSVRLTGRQWQNVSVRLAVALAFADASIVVLALPQIVARLHTSISDVTWVIMAYNLGLMVSAVAAIPFARRLASPRALVAGLAIFGVASIGCGLSGSMPLLVALRGVQGVGGGLLLCASLPVFASMSKVDGSSPHGWAAAAAVGMAIGPAAGGILTQIFDWRAIFLSQAPVAGLAAILVLVVSPRSETEPDRPPDRGRQVLDPLTANAGLTLLSAGLISALFLVVLLLIDVWQLAPIAAAAIATTIPLATAVADRIARDRSPLLCAAIGAGLVACGLLGLSFTGYHALGWVIIALALVGTGLGLSFPGLTTAALATRRPAAARAAITVTARDAGIVLGLLVLTPLLVSQLNRAPNRAIPAATSAVLTAPLPGNLKLSLAPGLIADYKESPQSELPDFSATFARADAHATRSDRVQLAALHRRLDSIVATAAANAFKLPLRVGAIFALIVLALLGLRAASARLRQPRTAGLAHPPA